MASHPTVGSQRLHVLFVCLGNICRSPMAQGIFQARIEQSGLAPLVELDSAGLLDAHAGSAPDERATSTALARDIDISDQRGRQMEAADLEHFDLILFMDRSNRDELENRFGSLPDKVRPMHSRREIPDPYHGSRSDFVAVFELLEQAAEEWISELPHLFPERFTTVQRT